MAGEYSFPLVVELEENNISKLKNKLVKYFQSRKSNGGDCEVDYENGSRTATVRFRREEDQRNVLKKESHEINVDAKILKMKVRLPTEEKTKDAPPDPVQKKFFRHEDTLASFSRPSTEPIIVKGIMAPPAEKKRRVHAPQKSLECNEEKWPSLLNSCNTNTDTNHQGSSVDAVTDNKPSGATADVSEAKGKEDDTPDEELCSNVALLENTNTLGQEFLEMLVENILKGPDSQSVPHFTLEVIPHMCSAVVSFQKGKDNTEFVTKCHENRTFKKKQLSVRPLELTDQVFAEDIRNLSEDILRLVFENADVDVENIMLNQVEQSAVITFKDYRDVQKVLKKKHHFKDEEIKVYPFYKSLGTALYGKDKPSLKPPASILEPIDESLWKYLNRSQSAAAAIRQDLAKHFCKVNFNQKSSACLSPEPSMLQQKDAKAIVRQWKDNVKSAFAQAMSKFKSLKFHPEPEAWQESEDKIRQMSEKEDVVIMPDKAGGVLLVAGPVDRINKLEKTFSEALNTIAKRVHREKSSSTDNITMSPSTFHILHQGGLKEKLQHVYPELKMSFMKDGSVLTVTGLKDEILAATKVIYDAILALKRQYLEIDNFVLDLLKDEEQEELSKVLLISQGINAAFEITSHRVQLLAVSDRDLKNAEDHLGKVLISEFIDVEDENVLKKPEWQVLVSRLEADNKKTWRKIRIRTTAQQVVVSGIRQDVIKVSGELKDFLTQNAQVEEVVQTNCNAIVEYITSDISRLEQMEPKVDVSYTEDSICLSGSRADVEKCKKLVENLVSSVIFENFKVPKPGVRKLFKDKQSMYTTSLLQDTRCLVQLVDEAGVGPDDLTNRSKPVYQLQTADGVDIAVCKADMCSYPVHAVVNSSNTTLKLDGGLAAALLKAAGTQLQDQCDKVYNSKGQLSPGECVITDAGGQLCCKKVIHAVGPHYDPKKHPKVVSQLKKAVIGSLELAEQHNCFSVALPAISRSQGFNLTLCANTIVKAVKEFCDDKYEDNSIKNIHFVNNDDIAVQAMEAAVRQEFGNHGVSHSQQSPQAKTKKLPLLKQAGRSGSDPNCLGQVRTKEGLDLTLMKGNIEKATTEVTVNTVFEDLDLSRGAVSSAIFREAGPNLQQLVKAKNATGTFGDIIVTGGGNLKSKQVFHAVSPHWDKGKGTTDKILGGIFKECLNKAEDTGLTSLSFPAIGTGNLGFPKDLVATLMLDEILSFSSKKQPKNLKKVMIILYSGDASTIQVFSDTFKKRFPNASAGKVSTPQSQGPFSKVVSSTGTHETKLGNVAIQVVQGDITKENTDVIVNSSNDSFSLKSGVSKAILDAAGQAVEAECKTLAAQPKQDMIMTQPGNLKCKKILHLVGQTDPVKIKTVVKDALQMCVKNTYTSVSFPAIGTGQGSVQAGQVADAMLDAVIEVLTQNTSSPLKTVRVVIFQAPMLNDFYNSMEQRSKKDETDAKGKKGFFGSVGSKLKSWFIGGADQHQEGVEGDFAIEAQKVDPTCFHICGHSQADVDSAKTWINDLISTEIQTAIMSDKAIFSFSKADYDTIADIQKNLDVCIRVESKKGDAAITIEGLTKDLLQVTNKINKMMREATDKEELRKKVELTSTVAEWQYQKQGRPYESFDATTNYHLEEALQNDQKTVTVTVSGQHYAVNMPTGPATDSQGQTLQIKRIDKLQGEDIPEHWDPMPGISFCKVTVKAGTGEYNEVSTLFKNSCNRSIQKIERIQNLGMWKGLMVKKYDMEQRNGHQNNLRRLFHGTCHTTVDWINKNGFNRSYAGKNAACYGNGTYFAVNANYSAADTYSRPNANGEKFMYLCQVLTGDFTIGRQGMNAPPEKTPGSYQLYDSLVDRTPTPSMFIIFHDAQAYPEYLITFK